MLRRHILPHLLPSATALATLNVSVAILLEAGLSYRWDDKAKAGIKDYNLLDLSI